MGYRELLKKYIRFLEMHAGDNYIEAVTYAANHELGDRDLAELRTLAGRFIVTSEARTTRRIVRSSIIGCGCYVCATASRRSRRQSWQVSTLPRCGIGARIHARRATSQCGKQNFCDLKRRWLRGWKSAAASQMGACNKGYSQCGAREFRLGYALPGGRWTIQKMTTTHSSTLLPKDPVTWWRESYQRDTDAFVRAHGRRPESLHELSSWLRPMPIRSEPLPRYEPH